jgi:hypothetical protein
MKKQPLPEEMGTYFLAAMSCPARRARPLAPAMPQATASSPTMHRAAAIRGAVPLNTVISQPPERPSSWNDEEFSPFLVGQSPYWKHGATSPESWSPKPEESMQPAQHTRT